MAMICCSECGKQISDKASVCPHCGAPIETAGCVVHFERKKNMWAGNGVNGNVIVDGKVIGSASNGSAFDVKLSYGNHSVSIESDVTGTLASKRVTSENINIPEGAKRVNITIKIKQDAFSVLSGIAKIGIGDIQVIE